MVTRKTPQPTTPVISREEYAWLKALNGALPGAMLAHNGEKITSTSIAHLAAEVADEALIEFHRRFPK